MTPKKQKITESGNGFKVFSLTSHPKLGKDICDYLGISEGQIIRSTFSCGELYTRMTENIRGDNVYLVQTTTTHVNRNIMELLITIDACKRASAKSVNVVIPYFPYSRQDKKSSSREPISARLVANLLETAGAERIITMDLHADQIQGFFNIPVDHLTSLPLFVDYFSKTLKDMSDVIVVAPDTGRAKAAKKFADRLGAGLAIIHKSRSADKHNESEVMHLIGEVKDKRAILYDDMVDTGGSIANACEALHKNGVKECYLSTTHAVFSGPAVDRLKNCGFKEVVVLDTIPLPEEKHFEGLTILETAPLLGEVIKRNHDHASISELYE